MVRILVAGILGAVILFAWGFVSWMLLHWHDAVIGVHPSEAKVVEALKDGATQKDVFWIPGVFHEPGMSAEDEARAEEDWKAKIKQGPIAFVVYDPEGSDPDDFGPMIKGFVIMLLTTLIAAAMLLAASPGIRRYRDRVAFVAFLGVFLALAVDASNWVWFHHPWKYCLVMAADHVVGWLLAAFFIAAIAHRKVVSTP